MKRLVSFLLLMGLLLVLTACADKDDQLKGEWLSTSPETTKFLGESFKMEDGNFKSSDSSSFLVYYEYSGSNKNIIKIYDSKPSSDNFDKDYPDIIGNFKIDGDKAYIETAENGKMTFTRK